MKLTILFLGSNELKSFDSVAGFETTSDPESPRTRFDVELENGLKITFDTKEAFDLEVSPDAKDEFMSIAQDMLKRPNIRLSDLE